MSGPHLGLLSLSQSSFHNTVLVVLILEIVGRCGRRKMISNSLEVVLDFIGFI